MAVKTQNKEKVYKPYVKAAAVILPIIAIITLMAVLGTISDLNATIRYSHFYNAVITGAEAEKQEDGSYIITVSIKNDSSYQTEISRTSIYMEYGNGTSLENRMPAYSENDMFRSLNRPIIPAGQTIEYQVQILPPEGINTVRLHYNGTSYNRYSITCLVYTSDAADEL